MARPQEGAVAYGVQATAPAASTRETAVIPPNGDTGSLQVGNKLGSALKMGSDPHLMHLTISTAFRVG